MPEPTEPRRLATVARYTRAVATASARSYGERCDACGRALPDDITGTCAGCGVDRDRHEASVTAWLAGRPA